MKQSLTEKLRIIYQNAKREFYKTPIQSSLALCVIISVLLQAVLILWAKGSSSNRIIKLLSANQELNLSLIILSLLLLGWALINLRHNRKEKKGQQTTFKFIDYRGASWKVSTSPNGKVQVDSPSYCIQHHVQHTEDQYSYICPICGSKNLTTVPYFFKDMEPLHSAVEAIVEARAKNHLKIK